MTITLNGTTGIVNTGSETITGALTAANFTAASTFGFKNRIINGAMVIDQRNAGASVTPTNGLYTLDRWGADVSQASKFTVIQSSTAPTGFSKSLLVTSSSAYTVGTNDYFALHQFVEGFNTADFNFGTASATSITLSFWVRSSLTGTFGVGLRGASNTRSYTATYTISTANTFEYKTITIPGDTSGTWLTNNDVGIGLFFSLGVGSANSITAGSWQAVNATSPTGAGSVVGTSGATWYVTGVQLETGTVATTFEYRPYGTELALCQRYFETSMSVAPADNMSVASTGVYAIASANSTPLLTVQFKVTKRADPTITYYAPLTTSPSGKVREDASGSIRTVTGGATTNWGSIIGETGGPASVVYQFGYQASAEL
jgi:hypothetical protein